MAKRRNTVRKSGKSVGEGQESPEGSPFPGLPPKNNLGRCKKCKRMLAVCHIEISRDTPSGATVMRRAYGCREHAAEVAAELVKEMATWTTWLRDDGDDLEGTNRVVEETFEEADKLVDENANDPEE